MSFNRLSTDEIDELKHMVRREMSEAESRLSTFLPAGKEADDDYADIRRSMIDSLNQKKAAMQSILGKLDRFHQSEVRRFYQPDHYNSNYNNNYNNSSNNYNNYQSADSDDTTTDRYRSEGYNN